MIKLNIYNNYNNDDFRWIFRKLERITSSYLKIKEKRVLNVVICDNEYIHSYNLRYRNVDSPTDVLSFPSDEKGELGDILISYPRAVEQSKEYGHSLSREMGFLLIHGTLHCLGYDHIEKKDEDIMFSLQEEILNKANLRRNV